MTRKDYELIAKHLADLFESPFTPHPYKVVHVVADALAEDNPKFDTAKFLKAVGI